MLLQLHTICLQPQVQNLLFLRNRGFETVENLRVSDEIVVAEAHRGVVLQKSLESVSQFGADLAVVPLADQLPHHRGLVAPRNLKM